jgi:hypothetical protein
MLYDGAVADFRSPTANWNLSFAFRETQWLKAWISLIDGDRSRPSFAVDLTRKRVSHSAVEKTTL